MRFMLIIWGTFLCVLVFAESPLASDELQTIDLDKVQTGQLLFNPEKSGGQFSLAPTLSTNVQMDIAGVVAKVEVSQAFSNTTSDWQHGTYVFPLPHDSAINAFSMKVGERLIEGEIKEKQQAKKIYNQAKKAGKKAALLTQLRPNMFTSKVANIPPGESIEVTLTYFQTARHESGEFLLDFPLTITPRYRPEGLPEMKFVDVHFEGSSDEEKSGGTKSTFSSMVDIEVSLKAGAALEYVKSLNHSVVMSNQDAQLGEYQINLNHHQRDKDFELSWRYEPAGLPRALHFSESYKDQQYGLMLLLPPEEKIPGLETSTSPRELILVLDTSGSMSGNSMDQAKQAFAQAMSSLSERDTFQVIEFDNQPRALFSKPQQANISNIRKALSWVGALYASGGTEIGLAFDMALAVGGKNTDEIDVEGKDKVKRLQQVVFFTDGAVGNEAEVFRKIQKNLGNKRIFTVGLGSAPNRYFMAKAAKIGRGSYQVVNSSNEIQPVMDRLFTQLRTPALVNISFKPDQLNQQLSGQPVEFTPEVLPDVYEGQPVVLSYRTDDEYFSGQLLGEFNGFPWMEVVGSSLEKSFINTVGETLFSQNVFSQENYVEKKWAADKKEQVPALAALWARRKIADLYDDLMLNRNMALKDSIVDIALRYSLVSPFTSFVAVEQIVSRPQGVPAKNKTVSNTLPKGQKLPQTSLNWQYELLVAVLAALLALLLLPLSQYFSKRHDESKASVPESMRSTHA